MTQAPYSGEPLSGIDSRQFNYQDPLDLVTGLEKNQRDSVKDLQSYFNNIIARAEEWDKRKASRWNDLVGITRQAGSVAATVWQENRAREVIDEWNTTDEEYDVKWKGGFTSYQEWEKDRHKRKSEINAAIQNGDADNVDAVQQISEISKPNDSKISELNNRSQHYLPFYATAANNMKVRLPEELGGGYATLATATPKQYHYIQGAIRKAWLMESVGSNGDPVSNHMIRAHLYPTMKKIEDQQYKTYADGYVKGIQAEAKHTDKLELFETLKTSDNGQAFLDHITRNLGDPKFGGNYGLTRKNTVDILVQGVKDGYIDEGDINKILDHEFTPNGWPEGKTTTIREHWKVDAGRLRAAVIDKQYTEAQNYTKQLEARGVAWVQEEMAPYMDGSKTWTLEAAAQLRKDFNKKFPGAKFPDQMSYFETAAEQDDQAQFDALIIKANKGLAITAKDYQTISDPVILEKAKALSKSTVENLTQHESFEVSGHAASIMADNPATVDRYENNAVARDIVGKRITAAIAQQFQAELKVLGPEKRAEALSNAVANVKSREAAGEFDIDPVTLTSNEDTTNSNRNSKATLETIAKDPYIATKNVRLPGEGDVQIREAVRYYEALQRGDRVRMPGYWREVGKNNTAGAKAYLESRLKALGILKDGDIVETNWEKLVKTLPPSYQNDLNRNPTDSKTYNIASKDANWMVESFYGDGGNDYDTIYGPDGTTKAELDKPLSQHTVGEVIDLMNQGYTRIGGFNLTNTGLRNVLLEGGVGSSQIGLDTVFDETTQNRLLLHSLRYKIRRRHGNNGVDTRWKRQVDMLTDDEQKQFESIIPGLSYMNQIHNLLPAVVGELY